MAQAYDRCHGDDDVVRSEGAAPHPGAEEGDAKSVGKAQAGCEFEGVGEAYVVGGRFGHLISGSSGGRCERTVGWLSHRSSRPKYVARPGSD